MRESSDDRWRQASLDSYATPVHRPDKARPAYWEIGVRDARGERAGFIVLSADRDDHPTPMLRTDGPTPSEELEQRVGGRAFRVVMPTIGSFVAEDLDGEERARVGELPPKIDGYDPSWLDAPEGSFNVGVEHSDGKTVVTPPKVDAPLRFSSWSSWRSLTQGYADAYGPLLERTRREAEPAWEREDLLASHGEVLGRGSSRLVPLLARGVTTARVEGSGRGYVRVSRVGGSGASEEALHLVVDEVPESEPAVVELVLEYSSEERETIRFVLAERGASSSTAAAAHRAGPFLAQVGAPIPMQVSGSPGAADPCFSHGARIALRTASGHFLAPGSDSVLAARAPQETAHDAVFVMEQAASGQWALKSAATGRYMSAVNGGGGALRVDRPSVHNWESFRLELQSDRRVALRTANGSLVSASGGGGGTVSANRQSAGDWERFTVACDPKLQETYVGASSGSGAFALQRKYKQIAPRVAPNTDSQCHSGCGPTAWAMVIGWSDLMASRANKQWAPHWGLYRSNGSRNGADAVAPEFNDSGVDAITIELRSYMGDWALAGCGSNGRWTVPHIMAQAHQYFAGRASVSLTADYDGAGFSTSVGVDKALRAINDLKRPVIIGTGHFAHYPVAYGHQVRTYDVYDTGARRWVPRVYDRRFVTNWGDGGNAPVVVPLSTWFQGYLHPNTNKSG